MDIKKINQVIKSSDLYESAATYFSTVDDPVLKKELNDLAQKLLELFEKV